MLTQSQGEVTEQSVLDRISIARGKGEPEAALTPEPEAVDVSEETPEEEVEMELETEAEVETEESEEPEVVEEPETQESDDGEDLYVEYKGREINLKDVEEWEQGHLRQADYTRKTQELADQRKAFDDERQQFKTQAEGLSEKIATLETIIAEETLTEAEVNELREFEPEKYIEYQEKQDRRRKAVEAVKGINAEPVDVTAERERLWSANPSWMDNGKPTQAYNDDMKLLSDYAADNGYSNEELASFGSARHFQTLLDAARYKQMSKKNAAVEKKVRKAPVSTKPKAAAKPALQEQIKKAEARLKQTGKTEDAVALRKLKRQLQN